METDRIDVAKCGGACGAPSFLPVRAACAAPLTLRVANLRSRPGMTVEGCRVEVVNADGVSLEKSAADCGGVYAATFPASHFARFGAVKFGVRVYAVGEDESGAEQKWLVACGDLLVVAVDASAEPGGGTRGRPEEVYLKSYVDSDGVQHYVKQTMELDPEIGWGANWTGDYVYSGGAVVPYEGGEE